MSGITADYLRLVGHCKSKADLQTVSAAARAKLIELNETPTGDFGDYIPGTDPTAVDVNFRGLINWVEGITDASGGETDLALFLRFCSCLQVSQSAPATDLDPIT